MPPKGLWLLARPDYYSVVLARMASECFLHFLTPVRLTSLHVKLYKPFFVLRDKGESSSRIMFKWTEEMEEQLIALVEDRPPLYNITLQGYSKRNRKDQLWREIESELHLSGNISYFCRTCNQCISTTMHGKQDLKIVKRSLNVVRLGRKSL